MTEYKIAVDVLGYTIQVNITWQATNNVFNEEMGVNVTDSQCGQNIWVIVANVQFQEIYP